MGDLFLSLSAVAMLVGMMLLIWHSTGRREDKWWDGEAKLAVTFTTLFFAVVVMFFTAQYTMYSYAGDGAKDHEDLDHEIRTPLLSHRN